MDEMEMTVAYHCAPALAGIKPSNLVSFCSKKHSDLDARIAAWNTQLNPKAVSILKKYASAEKGCLSSFTAEKYGSPACGERCCRRTWKSGISCREGLEAVIGHLKTRLSANGGFPHEVGLFLGYPLEDVHGFVRSGGRNYKLNGYWKVYSDEQKAKGAVPAVYEMQESGVRPNGDGNVDRAAVRCCVKNSLRRNHHG